MAREVEAERSRDRDVYLFPTRFLVTMASTQVRTHLARRGTDCGWLAVPVFLLVTYDTHVLGLPRRRPGPPGNLTRSRCQRWRPQTRPPSPILPE